MAEYIDRNAFLEHMKKTNRYFDVKHDIENFPTADVAPVVRCEGCVFSQSDGWVCGGTALMPQHRTFPNSFCSFGERKDSDAI